MVSGSFCDFGTVLRHFKVFEVFDYFFPFLRLRQYELLRKRQLTVKKDRTLCYANRVVMNTGMPQNNSYDQEKQPPAVLATDFKSSRT